MKTAVFVFVVSLLPLSVFSQSAILPSPTLTQGVPTSLAMALGKGDVEAIGGHMANKVEITIADSTATVSKSTAVDRLSEFYETHQAWGYHIQSTVEDARETGELTTLNGTFEVTIEYQKPSSKASSQKRVTSLAIESISSQASQ